LSHTLPLFVFGLFPKQKSYVNILSDRIHYFKGATYEEKRVVYACTFIMLIIIVAVIPIKVNPPGDTRVIIDRTKMIFIAPPCFEQAGATNNIGETTLDSINNNFTAESVCTSDLLKAEHKSLFLAIPDVLGVKNNKWDW
jgi:hypothetical protein